MIYNEEQQLAIKKATDFILNGNPKEFFLIDGKAGTGKTTVAAQIVRNFPKKSCAVAALSHKAKFVIMDKFITQAIPAGFFSIASLLGMKYDFETGSFSARSRNVPILDYDLIIIDEASMINEEALELIMEEKPRHAKVIFLGDIGQLPPIRTTDNPYYRGKRELLNLKSPVFETENRQTLYTRIRQGEESPILPYADHYWENSVVKSSPVMNPAPVIENMVTKKGALLTAQVVKDISPNILEAYQYAVKTSNPNHVKIVVYRNNIREALNKVIHERLFEKEGFCVGDLVIFNDKYQDVENATEGQIMSISERKTDEFMVQFVTLQVNVLGYPNYFEVRYCVPSYKKLHNKLVSDMFNKARAAKNSPDYYDLIDKAVSYKGRYANIDYGYAITSHKSQGSTYDIVIVMKDDIMGVMPLGNKEKSESIYTALTRARNVAVIVEGQSETKDFPESLHALSLKIDAYRNVEPSVPASTDSVES